MKYIGVETTDGKKNEPIYDINNFPFQEILFESPTVYKKSKKGSVCYYNIPCSFDIETTSLFQRDEKGEVIESKSFMYHWQFCLVDKVIFGRTWQEFLEFLDELKSNFSLSQNKRIVCYVHNLAFEWQFLKSYIKPTEYFFKDKRKPLKIMTEQGVEFRCSWMLSNMNLRKFCENSPSCKHYKLDGDIFNYSKIRYPWTELEQYELSYNYNDVRGLCECILDKLEDDTVATIPLTSTGYIRRMYRTKMNNRKCRHIFEETALNYEQYQACKKAFRGGVTHANRFYVGDIVEVDSEDITSSYPASMSMDYFPMSKFTEVTIKNEKDYYFFTQKFCCLMEIEIFDLTCKADYPIPYIDVAHCYKYRNIINDNGRVLEADYIKTWYTEIDMNIVLKEYEDKTGEPLKFRVNKCYVATRGQLPIEFISVMMELYDKKTTMKGIRELYYEYMKSKNALNGSYGMMVSDIIHEILTMLENNLIQENKLNEEQGKEELEKFYKSRNNFLPYQWGVWVCCQSRRRLYEMLFILKQDVIYVDTDSIKFLNPENIKLFDRKNEEIKAICENNIIPAKSTYNGKTYYLGTWDYEGHFKFKTWGAKKYSTEKDGKFEITVAGMSKKLGTKAVGDFDNFKLGQKYENVGRTVSYYDDDITIRHGQAEDGQIYEYASGVAIDETTYTLGITQEFEDVVTLAHKNKILEKNLKEIC